MLIFYLAYHPHVIKLLLHLKKICESTEEPLARDKDKAFFRFGDGETATNRLIRTLHDILGPRGDKKKWLQSGVERVLSIEYYSFV